MKVFWSYIVGMLTNLGPLPPDRIHSMLSMFVQGETKYEESLEDLKVDHLFAFSRRRPSNKSCQILGVPQQDGERRQS